MFPAAPGVLSLVRYDEMYSMSACISGASFRDPHLTIHLAENDVERADHGDHIGHQLSAAHCIERLQVHKRRRTHAQAIRLRRAIADNEVSEFTLGRFDRVVNLAR